jgi:hypothetical protein
VKLWPYTQSPEIYFRLLETPLIASLNGALVNNRPETVVIWQLLKLNSVIVGRAIWITVAIAFFINAIKFGLLVGEDTDMWRLGLDLVVTGQVYIVILLLPLWLPTMLLVARSYGNAQILTLLEALQQSNNVQFEDAVDVDEFDAAPPPTKNIATKWGPIWEKFLDQLIRFDVDFLARTTGLIESLADTTVICSIDREGTVSKSFPSVQKVYLPAGKTSEPVLLDVVELNNSGNEAVNQVSVGRGTDLNVIRNAGTTARIKFADDDWYK